jgi:hypothetical protein
MVQTRRDTGAQRETPVIGLAVVMLAGPGPWNLDAIIAARLAT